MSGLIHPVLRRKSGALVAAPIGSSVLLVAINEGAGTRQFINRKNNLSLNLGPAFSTQTKVGATACGRDRR